MSKRFSTQSEHTNEARPLGTPRPKPAKKKTKSGTKRASVMEDNPVNVALPSHGFNETVAAVGVHVDAMLADHGFGPDEKNSSDDEKTVDMEPDVVVTSGIEHDTAMLPHKEHPNMVLTLKSIGTGKKFPQAVYTGLGAVVKIGLAAFPGKTPPQTLEIGGEVVGPKTPKAKMTAEERKAARAAAPKLTLAEKIAKREAALARLKEKAAKSVAA